MRFLLPTGNNLIVKVWRRRLPATRILSPIRVAQRSGFQGLIFREIPLFHELQL
jgi:hypothetical protein